ncbi:glycosyltransferase family 4 protein [Halonotius sp. GCM10025705]|uniref:glycosyltransferase family 4 protein n=1 Tax=Halonotius sp. GCM10025705 TaxID=3252678 RepID=UPI003616D3AF
MEFLKFIIILPKSIHYLVRINKSDTEHIHAHWANMPTTIAYLISTCVDDISYSFTGHAWDIHSNQIDQEFLDIKIKQAEYVITCTKYNKKYLDELQSNETPIYINYHGVVPDKYHSNRKSEKQTYFVAGGRLVEKKGFKELIQAVKIAKEKYGCEIPVVLFGSGPQEKSLKKLKRSHNLENIDMTGKIPHNDVKEILCNAQVFVAPSIEPDNGDIDGIPNVVLEAFASTTPVIGSDLSGIPEVVKHNHTGWLVEPSNIEELAEALVNAWRSPALCKELGKMGEIKSNQILISTKILVNSYQ